jgi:hypothetical protein
MTFVRRTIDRHVTGCMIILNLKKHIPLLGQPTFTDF